MSRLRNHLITHQQAEELVAEYENKNYSYINSNRNESTPDSKEYYYDLHVLKDYITYVQQECENRGYENIGIKIRMGQYPDNQLIDSRRNPQYKGHQVAFLAPFYVNSNGENTDITDIESLDFTTICPPPY